MGQWELIGCDDISEEELDAMADLLLALVEASDKKLENNVDSESGRRDNAATMAADRADGHPS